MNFVQFKVYSGFSLHSYNDIITLLLNCEGGKLLIELKNVCKVYDDGFEALKDINLTFDEGKINVLIGPSGCGKTTTMKMLNKLVEHTSGTITIDGEDINKINPIELRRKMGYVIQSIGLFPHMKIYDNVATVPKLLKWDKQRIDKKVVELLEMVNLDPDTYQNRYPSELSGGQQQRIGVIRALAAEPSTILMDEPFSALDPISREQLQDELVRLQKEINKTIIFVTHDMDEAIKIANQIILMKDGEVVQKGAPDEILANPANDFVEKFIGPERLQQAKSFPSTDDLMDSAFPTLNSSSTVNDAIVKMVKYNLSSLPIINPDQSFEGIIHLYDAISNRNGSLKDIMERTHFAKENEGFERMVAIMEQTNTSILPIVSNDGKLKGVVNSQRLFHSFVSQCGGQ